MDIYYLLLYEYIYITGDGTSEISVKLHYCMLNWVFLFHLGMYLFHLGMYIFHLSVYLFHLGIYLFHLGVNLYHLDVP